MKLFADPAHLGELLAIAQFANEHQITIILLGETQRPWLYSLIHKPIWTTILRETRNIDVVIVATHE